MTELGFRNRGVVRSSSISYAGEDAARDQLRELLSQYKSERDWLRGIKMAWAISDEPIATRVLFGQNSVIFEEEGSQEDGRRVEAYSIAPNGVDLISGVTGDANRFSFPLRITSLSQLQTLEFRLTQIPRSE